MYTFTVMHDSEIEWSAWENLCDHLDRSSPFQRPEWFSFHLGLNDILSQPFALAVRGVGDELMGLVTGLILQEKGWKAVLTRRVIINGGVLLRSGCEEQIITVLLNALNARMKEAGVIYAEMRNNFDCSEQKPQFFSHGWSYEAHLNFHVDTTDREAMIQRMSSGRRRDIRYGEKRGINLRLAASEDDVSDWYTILKQLYQDKVKTPLPSLMYFKAFSSYRHCRLVVVEYKEKIIGGLLGIVEPLKVFCDLFCCGLDEEYKSDRVYPSILATWGAMELAHKEGIPRFDFMGAGKPGVPYGVRDFKAKFGGELVEHGRFIKVFAPVRYGLGKMAVTLMKKMKK